MLTVGVTGGVATGKSLVTQGLRALGATTFSADDAARAILLPGGATLRALTSAFGAEIQNPDGSLNRARLAERIFADTAARETLNRITHPPILRLLRAQIDAASVDLPPGTVVAVEVPLLFEAKMQDWFERIVVVSASETVQVSRLAARNLFSETEARRRIAAQMPLTAKIALADEVVINEATREVLLSDVERLWRKWTAPQKK